MPSWKSSSSSTSTKALTSSLYIIWLIGVVILCLRAKAAACSLSYLRLAGERTRLIVGHLSMEGLEFGILRRILTSMEE